MAKDEDVQDLDQIFETDDDLEVNESDEIMDSYMASEEDYKSDIGSNNIDDNEEETEYEKSVEDLMLNDEIKSEVNETDSSNDMDLIIENNDESVVNDNNVQETITNSEEPSEENEDNNESEDKDSSEDNENLIVTTDEEDNNEPEVEESSEDKTEEEIINDMVDPVVEKIEIEEKSESDDSEEYDEEDLELDDSDEETVVEDKKEEESTENVSEFEEKDEKQQSSSTSYKDFKREAFWRAVRETQDRYPETDLLAYIDQYKNEDNNAEIIKEMYSNVLIEYDEFIDFNNNEDARNNAWIIVGGKFADLIERRKEMGIIKSSVEVKHLGKVKDIDEIDDPNVQASMKDRKRHKEEVEKYGIDRTVFAIASDESEEDASIFEDKKAVDREFYEGPFHKILKEVMTSDRCADMSINAG